MGYGNLRRDYVPGPRGKEFAVRHYIKLKYDGLANIKMQDISEYPHGKLVTGPTGSQSIVFWDEIQQRVKEHRLPPLAPAYPCIVTYHTHVEKDTCTMELFFPDLQLTGFAESMVEAQEVLQGWVDILRENGKSLPAVSNEGDITLKEFQQLFYIEYEME